MSIKTWLLDRRQFLNLSGIGLISLLTNAPKISFAQARKEEKMTYAPKDFNRLLGMEGFSETLLKNHFTLYQGYVTNTNKLMETFGQMLNAKEYTDLVAFLLTLK